ncbi:MAG: fibrobacter succinogenes major paralogous domain-containing protein [Kofleriaceae bacterium]|nr:fibrobacter succinogenes major paralogous domain-containing protein [Kofleriaceae bacterium]
MTRPTFSRARLACLLAALAGCGRLGIPDVRTDPDGAAEADADRRADGPGPGPDAAGPADAASGLLCGDPVRVDTVDVPTVSIGSQCWTARNLDRGVRLPLGTPPSQVGQVEKYCYLDDPARCASEGGLYLWSEMMAQAVTEGARGICPAGWHIPSDAEWMLLEASLGMSGADQQGFGFRGTIAARLLVGGDSGFGARYSGIATDTRVFLGENTDAFFWASTEGLAGANGLSRHLVMGFGGVERLGYDKENAFAVRCVRD